MSHPSRPPSDADDARTLEPLTSEFEGDDDMAELIEYFVGELGHRVSDLRSAWSEGDVVRLRMLAHQMKGAAGGYGYPTISDVAATLEDLADRSPSSEEAIEQQLDELLTLCHRAMRH